MPRKIYIVGGIEEDHDREYLIQELAARTAGAELDWQWVKAVAKDGWRPPPNVLSRMYAELQRVRVPDDVKVVLLKRLHKDVNGRVKALYASPVLAADWRTGDELVDWLVSPEAGLVPGLPWYAELRQATFFSIIAKLLKNKSWNKDMHGHAWTQEADLLGQSPVNVPGRSEVRKEAAILITKMEGCVLLTKGDCQGKTKKEWCVNYAVLPAVKKAFLARTLKPLKGIQGLEAVLNYLESGTGEPYRLDDVIQEERVRYVCRDLERVQQQD